MNKRITNTSDPIGQLIRDQRDQTKVKEATCIKCGCTDSKACEEGCSWVWVDRRLGRGLCSACEDNGE